MKILATQISILLRQGAARRNMLYLAIFAGVLILLVGIFTTLFHIIMVYEDQDHSWISGLYWTLVTMSTLGFGDITFHSDIGRFFSVVGLLSGMIFLLVLLPFTFIEFFYAPFVKAQQEARAPRSVPPTLQDHVIIIHYDQVAAAFIQRLKNYNLPYILVVKNVEEALRLHDEGLKVVVADLEEPEAFANCGFNRAVMVAATADDFTNTSIAFTAREHSKRALIVATAISADSVDVLQLAGANHVLQLGEILGSALARRTSASDAQSHVIGNFGKLQIAESMVAGTPLINKKLKDTRLRELVGVTVVGLWQRGKFVSPSPDSVFTSDTMLVLAGTPDQLAAYNALFCIYHRSQASILIIGAGRVGRAAAKTFDESGVDWRILEQNAARIRNPEKYTLGSAADRSALERAGLKETPAVIITSREDAVNIYLSIYCRKLRPDVQIIARANSEGNVGRLHDAGADVVMSYAGMGSNSLFNLLRRENTLLVAEGLNIFRVPAPSAFIKHSIKDSNIRTHTGCSIIALQNGEEQIINPPPDILIEEHHELILIGTHAAEEEYCRIYSTQKITS
ncbi:MAG: potassium channel family protein [Chthoniobacterales bacterium]